MLRKIFLAALLLQFSGVLAQKQRESYCTRINQWFSEFIGNSKQDAINSRLKLIETEIAMTRALRTKYPEIQSPVRTNLDAALRALMDEQNNIYLEHTDKSEQ